MVWGLKKYGNGTFPKVPLSLQAGRVTKAEQLSHPATHLPQQMMIRREARAKHLPALLVWLAMIRIAETNKGYLIRGKKQHPFKSQYHRKPIEISILWQNALFSFVHWVFVLLTEKARKTIKPNYVSNIRDVPISLIHMAFKAFPLISFSEAMSV